MEGGEYRSRGACVRVEDEGIDVHDWYLGGLRLPWPVIVEIKAGTREVRGAKRRCLTLEVVDGSSLILPAPIGPPGGSALFEEQAGEIFRAYQAHGGSGGPTGPAGEARDEIPIRYRLDQLRRVDAYAGPSRLPLILQPISIMLFVFCLAELVGVAGSVHSYTRDLGGYDAYRAAQSCTVSDSAECSAGRPYSVVTDGVVTQAVEQLYGLYVLSVEPESDSDAGAGAVQYAYFKADPSTLESLPDGAAVDYVAANGGDVDSVTHDGVTYQTIDSPQSQDVYDWASVFAACSLTLLTAGLLGLRIARRGLVSWWAVPVLTITAAFVVNMIVAANQPAGRPLASLGSLLWLTGAVALSTTVAAAAACPFVLSRRERRPVSRRHRALP